MSPRYAGTPSAELPERTLRLARFWIDELETSVDRMDLDAAREALGELTLQLRNIGDFLGVGQVLVSRNADGTVNK
jgi:hypothetical protein